MTAERVTRELSLSTRKASEVLEKCLVALNEEEVDIAELKADLLRAKGQVDLAHDVLKQMEPLYFSRRRGKEVVESIKLLYSAPISAQDVHLDVIQDSALTVTMRRGHLLQVFNNLFDNAMFWLEHNPKEEKPRILIKISGKERLIIFADNGPGVAEYIRDSIFNPFVSTKPNGRGLGLYIVEDILRDYGAKIELMTEDKILDGTNFEITFQEKTK